MIEEKKRKKETTLGLVGFVTAERVANPLEYCVAKAGVVMKKTQFQPLRVQVEYHTVAINAERSNATQLPATRTKEERKEHPKKEAAIEIEFHRSEFSNMRIARTLTVK